MSHELINTSAGQGLHNDGGGYTTVAESQGIPKSLVTKLEMMCGYRHRVKSKVPNHDENPIAFSHTILSAGGSRFHVVSRVADHGFDRSNRTNYLAHHVALQANELPEAGPAWLCLQRRFFTSSWDYDDAPKRLSTHRDIPDGSAEAKRCKLWEKVTGDAGWGGVVAEAFASQQPIYVVYEPGQPVLELLAEAIALMPASQRWKATFNTYFTESWNEQCTVRCVTSDSIEATAALSAKRSTVVRLDQPMRQEPGGSMVQAARTGDVAREVVVVEDDIVAPDEEITPRRRRSAVEDDEPKTGGSVRRQLREREERDSGRSRPERTPRRSVQVDSDAGEDSVDELTRQVETGTSGGISMKQLLIGMILGVLLTAVVFVLIEVAAGKSMLRMMGVVGKDEKQLQTAKADLEKELEEKQAAWLQDEKVLRDQLKSENRNLSTIESAIATLKGDHQKEKEQWEKDRKKLQGDIKDKQTMLENAQGQIEVLQKQVTDKSSSPPPVLIARTISLARAGKSQAPVLPAGTKATLTLTHPPGVTVTKNENEFSISINESEIAAAKLRYEAETGSILFDNEWKQPQLLLLGEMVATLEYEQSGKKRKSYFQLASPAYIDGTCLKANEPGAYICKIGSALKLNPKDNFPKQLAFAGQGVLIIDDQTFILKPDKDQPAAGSLILAAEGGNEIEMTIVGQNILVTLKDKSKKISKMRIAWAEVVGSKRPTELSHPPAVFVVQ
ncbi:MAG: hypothetical protein R3B84_21365 [Zavarzinella sp.]